MSALNKLTYGLYVLGTEYEGKYYGCIVDAVMQYSSKPDGIAVSVMRKNLTREILQKSRTFTLSVLSENVNPFLIANFGFQSGRIADKWANCEFKLLDGCPVLKDSAAYILCEVNEVKEYDSHFLFLSNVLESKAGEGEPLIYADYHKKLKNDVMNAFMEYKNKK